MKELDVGGVTVDLTPGQQSDHYKQTTSLIFRWMRDAETATPKALYRMLDGAGLLLTDKGVEEIRQAAYRAGREDAAKAIQRVAESTRESLISTPPEYVNEANRHRIRAQAFERAVEIARGGAARG